MSAFQIVVLIWLALLTLGLAFTFFVVTRWVALHDSVDDRVKDLEQDKRGNPFVAAGEAERADAVANRGAFKPVKKFKAKGVNRG